MEKKPEGKNALRAATGFFTGGCSPCRASARKTGSLPVTFAAYFDVSESLWTHGSHWRPEVQMPS